MKDEYITTAEAARILGVSAARVRQFIMNARLESIKLGRDQFLKKSEVEEFSLKPRKRTGRPKKNMS